MKKVLVLLLALALLSGCNTVISENKTSDSSTSTLSFKDSELDSSYSINGSTYIELDDEDIKISKGGTYILSGELNDASIIIETSDSEKVQLVLDGVTINANDFAGIYIVESDEVTITLAENSVNTITDNGTYTQIDSNSVDALIFSKADLTINGSGTLVLKSDYNHGVVSKDDLIITGGTYDIDVAGQGLSGKDCLKISDGIFNIDSGKDALKSDNSEDADRGFVYITGGTFILNSYADGIYGYNLVKIEGGTFDITTNTANSADSFKAIKSDYLIEISAGTFTINSADDGIHSNGNILISDGEFIIESSDDGIHADGLVQIDNGNITINAHEGIEGTYVLINDGTVNINATDDAINAGQKSDAYTPTIEINGGYITVNVSQGDTDAIDSNANIYVNGGTLDITAQSPFDYDGTAEYNGGTIIVNGTQTNTITNQMMMGMGGFGSMMPSTDGNTQFPNGNQMPQGGQPGFGKHH